MRELEAGPANERSAPPLLDLRYVPPTFRSRRRDFGFELLARALGRANYERLRFWRRHGYVPNLRAPVSFNEKLAARKVYEDIPNAPTIVDKIAVRDIVREKVGEQYLNEVYLVADDTKGIDYDRLPEAFVGKANHGSKMNVFVSQKSGTDLQAVSDQLDAFLRKKIGRVKNEWWYEKIRPQLLFERFLDSEVDYRFWIFHGVVQYVKTICQRGGGGMCYYDRDWRLQEFGYTGQGCEMPRPAKLDEMIEVAEALSLGLPFVRVDLFSPHDSDIVFSEITLAPGSGWEKRSEAENRLFGELW